jgi:signal transduction histidine kinase
VSRSAPALLSRLLGAILLSLFPCQVLALEPLYHTVEQLRDKPRSQLIIPKIADQKPGSPSVRLEGVVTYIRNEAKGFNFNLDDGTGGIMVYTSSRLALRIGQRVRVSGHPEFRRHGVTVSASEILPGTQAGLPEPLEVTLPDLASGRLQGRYVEVDASVRRVRLETLQVSPPRLALDLGSERKPVHAWIMHYEGNETRYAPGMVLKLRGVCLQWTNARGQGLSTVLLLNSTSDVTELESAPQVPRLTIGEIQEWLGREGTAPRVACEGVVTLVRPGELIIIQQDARALRLRPLQPDPDRTRSDLWPCAVGERVQVAGFPAMGAYTMELEYSEILHRETGPLPEPERFGSAEEVHRGAEMLDRDARFVELEGRLAGVRTRSEETLLQIASGQRVFEAALPAGTALGKGIREGAVLRLRGVCILQPRPMERRFGLAPSEFSLALQDASSIQVVRGAPWWTHPRLLSGLALASPLALLSLGWAAVLRRKNHALKREMLARKWAEQHLQHERERVAADLHDTLQQTLLAADLQLNAAQRILPSNPAAALSSVALANQLLTRGRDEMREAVWALHSNSTGDLETQVQKIADETSALGAAEVRLFCEGEPRKLPPVVSANAVRIVREAVSNALKHAAPARIRIHLHFEPDSLALAIDDDGAGFDPDAVKGPETGHFGLTGIRERVARLGGHLRLESAPGAGTRLHLHLPLKP